MFLAFRSTLASDSNDEQCRVKRRIPLWAVDGATSSRTRDIGASWRCSVTRRRYVSRDRVLHAPTGPAKFDAPKESTGSRRRSTPWRPRHPTRGPPPALSTTSARTSVSSHASALTSQMSVDAAVRDFDAGGALPLRTTEQQILFSLVPLIIILCSNLFVS